MGLTMNIEKNHPDTSISGIGQGSVRGSDVVIASGLSVHFFGKTVGIYSTRLQSGKGFTELPIADLQELIEYFRTPDAQNLLVSGS